MASQYYCQCNRGNLHTQEDKHCHQIATYELRLGVVILGRYCDWCVSKMLAAAPDEAVAVQTKEAVNPATVAG